MNRYEEARNFAIRSLENALIAHQKTDVFSIGDGLEKYEVLISREDVEENSLLYLTLDSGQDGLIRLFTIGDSTNHQV